MKTEVVPDILYYFLWFLKENFMMVIRELEMAWIKIRRSGIRILSGNKFGIRILSGN